LILVISPQLVYQEGGEDCPGDAAGGGTDRLFSSP
jgi:hypothetical protein